MPEQQLWLVVIIAMVMVMALAQGGLVAVVMFGLFKGASRLRGERNAQARPTLAEICAGQEGWSLVETPELASANPRVYWILQGPGWEVRSIGERRLSKAEGMAAFTVAATLISSGVATGPDEQYAANQPTYLEFRAPQPAPEELEFIVSSERDAGQFARSARLLPKFLGKLAERGMRALGARRLAENSTFFQKAEEVKLPHKAFHKRYSVLSLRNVNLPEVLQKPILDFITQWPLRSPLEEIRYGPAGLEILQPSHKVDLVDGVLTLIDLGVELKAQLGEQALKC